MKIINAVILGIVQGFTEFFPVSSSGHLAVLSGLFNLTDTGSGQLLFNSMVNLGTLIALCVVYWQEICSMLFEIGSFVNIGPLAGKQQNRYPYARQAVMLIVATLPLFLILGLRKRFEALTANSIFIGAEMVLTGCILYVSDKLVKGVKTEKNITLFDAVIIGLCQCTAAVPGISRVGVTTAAGIANGLDGEYAYKFAVLMSIPVLFGSNLLSLIDALKGSIDVHSLPAYFIGMACAIVSGIAALTIMKKYFKNGKFGHFAYYCWLVGALSIILTMIF